MINIIGAGLAGCEAAWQIAKRGEKVRLYEQKPHKFSPAHKSENFAELVCSNSLRADGLKNAVGLLKEEMRRLDSLVIKCADETRVPAGGALAVDREGFSKLITEKIYSHKNIEVISQEVSKIPDGMTIIATGPLTDGAIYDEIKKLTGEEYLHFHDAAAPIVSLDSIDMSIAYRAARYGKGSDDYINCPMTKEEYAAFYFALISARPAELHEFEPKVFEGCMPVEIMAKRGEQTLLFGPLKPVGLEKPDGTRPHAVVQLRQDNAAGTLYNIVGFQTHLAFPEQQRVFRMIPGLQDAEFMRYGVMHRNTYINSPCLLNTRYQLRSNPNIFFAGQITGVEGYVESASSGLVAGINAIEERMFSPQTATGALANYIVTAEPKRFQPMNINFGIIAPIEGRWKEKAAKYEAISQRALETL